MRDNHLAMRDMDMGKIPMLRPPMRYSEAVTCLFLAKKAKYTPMSVESSNIAPNTE